MNDLIQEIQKKRRGEFSLIGDWTDAHIDALLAAWQEAEAAQEYLGNKLDEGEGRVARMLSLADGVLRASQYPMVVDQADLARLTAQVGGLKQRVEDLKRFLKGARSELRAANDQLHQLSVERGTEAMVESYESVIYGKPDEAK